MQAVLKVKDECFGTGSNERRPAFDLKLVSQRMSARDVIRQRIADEIATANARAIEHAEAHARTRSFLIAFEPSSPEAALNAPRSPKRRQEIFDEQAEYDRAILAFEKRQFIMLLDERQIENLDDEFGLTGANEIVFLYLTPLVGG
jgi:enoyl-CoA hydratase/carnithine racemase